MSLLCCQIKMSVLVQYQTITTTAKTANTATAGSGQRFPKQLKRNSQTSQANPKSVNWWLTCLRECNCGSHWKASKWLSIPSIQIPDDIVLMQYVIYNTFINAIVYIIIHECSIAYINNQCQLLGNCWFWWHIWPYHQIQCIVLSGIQSRNEHNTV